MGALLISRRREPSWLIDSFLSHLPLHHFLLNSRVEIPSGTLLSELCFRKLRSLETANIPQVLMKDLEMKKLYYSISEVSKMVDLEPYVLRYWEREFSQLRPQKNRAGNRIYTEKEIELVKLIKRLTREDRYTISGARQVLEQLTYENGLPVLPEDYASAPHEIEEISTLADDLREVRETLVKLLDKLKNESSVQRTYL